VINETEYGQMHSIFNQVKEKLLQDYKNLYLEHSYSQIRKQWGNLMLQNKTTKKQLRKKLEEYTFDKF